MFFEEDKHCNCDCGDEHGHGTGECNCDDENCDCESNTITLDMEDGTQKDFTVLDILEHDGKKYIALAELDSSEYDILGMEVTDETVSLTVIEDDDEFDAVAAKFEELFSREEEEEE
jgi:uncharacterized protein YrzB (UPF0473 family)